VSDSMPSAAIAGRRSSAFLRRFSALGMAAPLNGALVANGVKVESNLDGSRSKAAGQGRRPAHHGAMF